MLLTTHGLKDEKPTVNDDGDKRMEVPAANVSSKHPGSLHMVCTWRTGPSNVHE